MFAQDLERRLGVVSVKTHFLVHVFTSENTMPSPFHVPTSAAPPKSTVRVLPATVPRALNGVPSSSVPEISADVPASVIRRAQPG